MDHVEAQGKRMKAELFCCFKAPLYWLVMGSGISVRMVMAYFDRLYRAADFWTLSERFWDKIGSVTVGILVLLVLIRSFSIDREHETLPVINSTARGRGILFLNRFLAGSLSVLISVLLLSAGNYAVTMLLAGDMPRPQDFLSLFGHSSVTAMIGTVGYFVFSASVCDLLQNQPAAMCICGVPFGIGYFINTNAIEQFDLFWFFRYGFFTELTRGRPLMIRPLFWAAWYSLLTICILWLATKKKRERKEL